jgi:hypothetical protein
VDGHGAGKNYQNQVKMGRSESDVGFHGGSFTDDRPRRLQEMLARKLNIRVCHVILIRDKLNLLCEVKEFKREKLYPQIVNALLQNYSRAVEHFFLLTTFIFGG